MLRRFHSAVVLTFFLATSTVSAKDLSSNQLGQISAQGLTREQAKQVLRLVLKHEGYNLKTRGIFIEELEDDKEGPPLPGYFQFALGFDNPNVGAIEYRGLYVVSISSGDVWETHLCNTFSFPALKRIQAQIRTKTKISVAEERVLRRGLGCTD